VPVLQQSQKSLRRDTGALGDVVTIEPNDEDVAASERLSFVAVARKDVLVQATKVADVKTRW
jgi:hypothetical protein